MNAPLEDSIGMLGLGVMGRNLAYNFADHGFRVVGTDAWPDAIARFTKECGETRVETAADLVSFVAALPRPRKIIVLVKAGEVTEKTLTDLRELLDENDVVVDGGNEHFAITERRALHFRERKIHFFGMGVSGGEEGARRGPALMPGGDPEAYALLKPAFEKIAAKHEGSPCVSYCGPGGAGHYVKMVHNGIEYADMQLLAETYAILKHVAGLSNADLADTFESWNEGELGSFLVEITGRIFRSKDDLSAQDRIDIVLDKAAQKGTGKWTVQDAASLGCAIPTIAASVDARFLAARKSQRVALAQRLTGPKSSAAMSEGIRRDALVESMRHALFGAKLLCYAQGFDLLAHASLARAWNLPFAELARIWQGGCIIRAKILTELQTAFTTSPELPHLFYSETFAARLKEKQAHLRSMVQEAAARGIAAPALSSALAYYDTLRTERLPANLTQAQRDLFGAHGYERIDREGDFHSNW
jgi:6-phosphogluconate dehydrogenase